MDQQAAVGPTRAQFDTDADRYPSIKEVFAVVLDRLGEEDSPVERVEVTALASGEATYRVWPAREEDPETGYLPPEAFD